jgi:hypothetical protein
LLSVPERSATIGPGEQFRIDHAYCFSEVQVLYSTTSGTLYSPVAYFSGGFQGTDWRGQATTYSASGFYQGTPALGWYRPQSEGVAIAKPEGQVTMAIPQGTYEISPTVNAVNEVGQVSQAGLAKVNVQVGCGQRLQVVPGLSVSVDSIPRCAQAASVALSGRVRGGLSPVERIWYRVNGGSEQDLCTGNCGLDPAFEAVIALPAVCTNTIEVFARSPGVGTASASVQVVWDDPQDGVICGDGSCGNDEVINRQPVALCADRIVPAAPASCSAEASVDAGSFDPDASDAVTLNQAPPGPYGLGSTAVTLTAIDRAGLSATCTATVTVVDEEPPSVTCPAIPPVAECQAGGAVVSYEAGASDNCSAVVLSCDHPSGGRFGLGTTRVTCKATDEAGLTAACSFNVEVVDTTPPTVSCVESYNPSTQNVPRARRTNEDGFYRVDALDTCGGVSLRLGPYELAPGSTIKITQRPGVRGVTRVGDMGPGQIPHFLVGPGDAVIVATDTSGNTSGATCLVPPPPK